MISCFFIFKCTTLGQKIVQTIDKDSLKIIEDIELLLLQYQEKKDIELLQNAEKKLQKMENQAKNNRFFEAIILGIYGEIAYFRNDYITVRKNINSISSRNQREERLVLLQAYLEKKLSQKLEILKKGLVQAETTDRIRLFLADLLFYQADFRQALAYYDESFLHISNEKKEFFEKRRQLSFEFIDNPLKNNTTISIVMKDSLILKDILQITANETDYLKNYPIKRSLITEEIVKQLKNNGYIQDVALGMDDIVKRKDIACYLLKIVEQLENDPGLLTKYSMKDTSLNEEVISPVPDIRVKDYFYNAVLILVEREIMELLDGENFFPENTMNGLHFYKILKKIMDVY